jgi:hypothetical protein
MTMVGHWRMVEMDLWNLDAMDLVDPAFIEFHRDGTGRFRFIAVDGFLDWRDNERDGCRGVEFTWDGSDEGDHVSGRGWAVLEEDGSLRGHIYFHLGDDSGFEAVRPADSSDSESVDT